MKTIFEAGLGESDADLIGLLVAKNEEAYSLLKKMLNAKVTYRHDEYDLETMNLLNPSEPESVAPSLRAVLKIEGDNIEIIRTVYREKYLRNGMPVFRPEKYQRPFQSSNTKGREC